MTRKKLRLFNTIKEYLAEPKTERLNNSYNPGPRLEPYSTQRHQEALWDSRHRYEEIIPSDDEVDKINRDRIEQAKLSQGYDMLAQSTEALNLTLKSQHKLLIATLITALVALFVGIMSLIDKPPTINVYPTDAKTNVAPYAY